MAAPLSQTQRVQKALDLMRESAIAPYGSLSTAAACTDGLASRLAWALSLRNSDPDGAREHLAGAFAAFEIVKRVMADLEADVPELAGRGCAMIAPTIDALDRRDRRGAYA